ncbi:MAG TPA: DUF2846 domain-containing protein [Cycloclasticus sp.]|jgi:hypothetical protein|nr:DUF2846 domain-containing protein [Cycloclasticus sp.]
MNKVLLGLVLLLSLYGCASVPMASDAEDHAKKQFTSPPSEIAGLYIYRNSNFGGALKKTLSIDGEVIGESAPMTYFYRELNPGKHILSTESEFSDNIATLNVEGGKNYYMEHFIKVGVFVGGANFTFVSEEVGQKGVLECKLAK